MQDADVSRNLAYNIPNTPATKVDGVWFRHKVATAFSRGVLTHGVANLHDLVRESG
jgi:hypothetical protein